MKKLFVKVDDWACRNPNKAQVVAAAITALGTISAVVAGNLITAAILDE